MMTSTKRTYEETARIHNYDTKRAKNTKNSVILPVVSGPSRRASSNYEFLDDTTGFADGLSLHQFINPQAAKLYNAVRVRAFAFS